MKNGLINWFLSISGVGAAVGVFFKVYGARIFKGITISRDIFDLVDDLQAAFQTDADGKVTITPEELKKFQDGINKLRADLDIKDTLKKGDKK